MELFSKRQRKLTNPTTDVYLYDTIPEELKNQILYIWDEALGDTYDFGVLSDYSGWNGHERVREAYDFIWNTFRREHGMSKDYSFERYRKSLMTFFISCTTEQALDLIELSFIVIDKFTRNFDYKNASNHRTAADAAITELNQRFEEHGIGYKYESGRLIRVDSKFMHQEVIKPALVLLHEKRFAGANDEFLKAHEDYRKGDHKDCIHKACQAFESVMKVICKSNGWVYDENAPAKKLITILIDNGLIKNYSADSYHALVKLLENAIPTPRNKEASHGQGEAVKYISPNLASYILNLTASTMLYLVEAENEIAGKQKK